MKAALQNLTGFKRGLVLFMAGALSTLAMPPAGLFPILLVTLPALFWLTGDRPLTRGFWLGWIFGAGYFITGLYWISAALFVDIDQWKWVLPLSLVVGPSLLGVFYAVAVTLAHVLSRFAQPSFLVFALSLAGAEYLRGHILTGFPWNLTGYAWDQLLPMLQITAVIGIYGLGFLTIFWGLLPVYWQQRGWRVASLASLTAVALYGVVNLSLGTPAPDNAPLVRIVQASIPQKAKWDPEAEWKNLETHVRLSKNTDPDAPRPTFVIWPETAVTVDLHAFPEVARFIALSMPKDSIGILGSLRYTLNERQEPDEFFNSVTVLNSKADILATYDKHHLVPFGEYIPFRDKLALTPIALALSGIGDFTAGVGPQTLSAGNDLPTFSPLVCYEVIFPHAVTDPRARPDFLVNVTNDAWYGRSAGPHQHLAIARVRAIEEGLPLLRAANNGISAVVDAKGRIMASLPLDAVDVIDAPLPPALSPTVYSRWGDSLYIFSSLVLLVAAFMLRRHTKQ